MSTQYVAVEHSEDGQLWNIMEEQDGPDDPVELVRGTELVTDRVVEIKEGEETFCTPYCPKEHTGAEDRIFYTIYCRTTRPGDPGIYTMAVADYSTPDALAEGIEQIKARFAHIDTANALRHHRSG